MRIVSILKKPGQLYYGWRIVALGALANAVSGGVYNYGFGIFFLPISRDLGLSRAAISSVFSLARAEGAFEGPLAGWLVDKYGPKYILFAGTLLMGLGYLLLARVDNFLTFLVVYVGIISLGFNGGFTHTVMTAINSWFIRQRGLAFSITLSAYSVGGAVLSPLLSLLVAQHGWQTASVLSGVAIWVFILPTALGFKRSPESMGLAPDGDPAPLPGSPQAWSAAEDYTVGEALRTSSYWGLAVVTTLRLAVINAMTIHFVPMMVWKGASEPTGALLLGAMAFLSIPFRILLGWLGDRVPKNYMVAGGIFMGLLALIELQFAQAEWQLWVFVVVFSLVEGVIPLNWAMIGDFFGRTKFATLRGLMGLVYTWGAAIAPVFAGYVYDQTSSYTLVVWTFVVLFGLSSVGFFFLRPPRRPPTPASPEVQEVEKLVPTLKQEVGSDG